MKRIITSTILVLLLMLCTTPVYAGIPTLPHAFYGDVEINDSPAPDGTQVSATVDVGDIVSVQNPVITKGGSYGVDSPYLLVQGNGLSGTVTFYVDGIEADQTDTFEVGSGPTECDLSVEIAEPKPTPTGGAAPSYSIETDLFGMEGEFNTSSTGKVRETIEATSEDGNLTITIPKGTIALDKKGRRLKSFEATIDKHPPKPPEDARVIGLAYNFEPDGATFDPEITLTWTYDPEVLPKGVDEEDLVVAYYNEATEEWVELVCEVDTRNNLITAFVSHFTTFAVIGKVLPLPEPEPVVEPEPIPEPVPEPAPAPPEPVVPEPEEPEIVPEPAGIQGWWIVLGIVCLIAIGVIFWVRRRQGR